MIIHKLIAQFLGHRDNSDFYLLQANDALQWIERTGVSLIPGTKVLDLGCGHGLLGLQFARRGCRVTYADESDSLLPEVPRGDLKLINLDFDDVGRLGTYDLVICSNVYEHLAHGDKFISSIGRLLRPGGFFYLSWTNWFSPWGGHEFSPFHYLGAKRGHLFYDRFSKATRKHTPYVNLFPTYIGNTLTRIRMQPELSIVECAPRYYPEFWFLVRIPVLREFVTWNCVVLLRRANEPSSG